MGSDIDIYIGGGGLYQSKKVKPSQGKVYRHGKNQYHTLYNKREYLA